MRIAILGLWSFTNLELAYALLRVDERARALPDRLDHQRRAHVVLTVWLVVFQRQRRATGCWLGNFTA